MSTRSSPCSWNSMVRGFSGRTKVRLSDKEMLRDPYEKPEREISTRLATVE